MNVKVTVSVTGFGGEGVTQWLADDKSSSFK